MQASANWRLHGVGFLVEAPSGRPDRRLRLVGTILLPRR